MNLLKFEFLLIRFFFENVTKFVTIESLLTIFIALLSILFEFSFESKLKTRSKRQILFNLIKSLYLIRLSMN